MGLRARRPSRGNGSPVTAPARSRRAQAEGRAGRARRDPDRRVCRRGSQGVDALEAYFGRFLPQLVLAAVVPLAVHPLGRRRRPRSAAIMAATLPLVPVFMVLVGSYTGHATRDQLASARRARDALPRRRARPADAARVQPRPRAGGLDRGCQRALPAGDHEDAASRVPLGRRAGAGSDARRRLVAVTVGVRLAAGVSGWRLH